LGLLFLRGVRAQSQVNDMMILCRTRIRQNNR
jgi:hypothetical protein